eukprot:CAMPEP_0203850348 /NCGR_PEP_ID=MMETSP0359-20131031/6716_1 /ASSEMBLY_ACC=CAM_ASM_000338 /TAXON_ID=268821 /ORGANISM="Scrippsiella Hangoei, Strain SHTV-5" /LENGTH=165 /DNA_ID=CAMNT_0050766225 /DNA_START=54 /DNA_END=548 /DNA_ORIENTATION=-
MGNDGVVCGELGAPTRTGGNPAKGTKKKGRHGAIELNPGRKPLRPAVQRRSARLEEQDRDLSQVKVDEVLCLVRDVGAEVAPDDDVPSGIVLFVELLLDEGGDILLDVVLFQGLGGAVDRVLLHVLRHVRVLDHCLAVRHFVLDVRTGETARAEARGRALQKQRA